jgi:hypothetical protein
MIDIDKPEIDEDAEMAEEAEIAKANADITAEVMKRLEAWNGESVDDIVRDLEKLIASGTTEDLAEAEAVLADRSLVPFPSGPRNSSAFDWWGIDAKGVALYSDHGGRKVMKSAMPIMNPVIVERLDDKALIERFRDVLQDQDPEQPDQWCHDRFGFAPDEVTAAKIRQVAKANPNFDVSPEPF